MGLELLASDMNMERWLTMDDSFRRDACDVLGRGTGVSYVRIRGDHRSPVCGCRVSARATSLTLCALLSAPVWLRTNVACAGPGVSRLNRGRPGRCAHVEPERSCKMNPSSLAE